MSALFQPPPGGRVLYCPCGRSWASVQGHRPVLNHAACIVRGLGLDRLPCLSCGDGITAVPALAEART